MLGNIEISVFLKLCIRSALGPCFRHFWENRKIFFFRDDWWIIFCNFPKFPNFPNFPRISLNFPNFQIFRNFPRIFQFFHNFPIFTIFQFSQIFPEFPNFPQFPQTFPNFSRFTPFSRIPEKSKKTEIFLLIPSSAFCQAKRFSFFFEKWGDVFDERPKSGKTMRYRVESCFIRFKSLDLPHAYINRFLNKCNPEELTAKRWKKVGFLPDFFENLFLFFPELPARTFLEAIKKWTVFIFDGISKLWLRFSLGPHLHLFWKKFKNAFFSGRL